MTRFFFLLAVLLALSSQAISAALSEPPRGNLVVIGGALREDNVEVWSRLVQLAGGKGAKIAVIPAAAANPKKAAKLAVAFLNKYGADAFVIPVSANMRDTDVRVEANCIENAERIEAAQGVYFLGGNQDLIVKALRQPDGTNSLVLDAIWKVYRRGGVIAGSSAGAAIMSEQMFNNAESVLQSIELPFRDEREVAHGLGFVGPGLFVDQHAIVRGRFARMISLMAKRNLKVGLGIDENTAMVINPNHDVEIIGYKGAILIDMGEAKVNRQSDDFNVQQVKISYLDHGDRFNYYTKVFTPSRDKQGNLVDRTKPYFHEKLFSADILGDTTAVNLMQNLIDSDQSQAIGLAIPNPTSSFSGLGFEFVFTRTDQSVGYLSGTSESYSVFNLSLDIRPIRINSPLYRMR